MSTPYPEIQSWVLPKAAITATLAGVRPAGDVGVESGVFWMGTRDRESRVSHVLQVKGKGVVERPYQWRIAPEVFGSACDWAKPQALTLLAIVHIHLADGCPEMSWTDRNCSVQVPGILAVIIGNRGRQADPREWGWFVYENRQYRKLASREVALRVDLTSTAAVGEARVAAEKVWDFE